MSIVFNADEILEMAARIERNGAAFYRKAAETNPGEQVFLLDLAEQEDEHLALFQKMREGLNGAISGPTAFDPDGEAALYLKAMADGSVFDVRAEPAALLKGSETLPEIIRTAIGLEKDSVMFYLGLREIVPAKFGADKVDAVIREEMKHVSRLSEKLKTGERK